MDPQTEHQLASAPDGAVKVDADHADGHQVVDASRCCVFGGGHQTIVAVHGEIGKGPRSWAGDDSMSALGPIVR